MQHGGGPLFCTLEAGRRMAFMSLEQACVETLYKLECEVLGQQTGWLRKGGAVI